MTSYKQALSVFGVKDVFAHNYSHHQGKFESRTDSNAALDMRQLDGTQVLKLDNTIPKLTVYGDLDVLGNANFYNSNNFEVEDNMIKLASGNGGDVLDIGFFGEYDSAGKKYAAFYRNAGSNEFRLYTGILNEPGTTVSTAGATLADLRLGDLYASAITGTLQTAQQTNITQVGTLSSLDDNGTVKFPSIANSVKSNALYYDSSNGNITYGAAGVEFSDVVFRILNAADNTKTIAFDASNITSGVTRTIYATDYDMILPSLTTSTTIALGDNTITSTTLNFHINIGSSSNQTAKVNILGNNYEGIQVFNTASDATSKGASAIVGARYSIANEPFAAYATWDNNTDRILYMGGGNWNMPDATQVRFYTSSTYTETINTAVERMRIDKDGNVGIGTTSPNSTFKLTLENNGLFARNSGNDTGVYIDSLGGAYSRIQSVVYANNSTRPLILQPYGGNVGINTTSPSMQLDVNQSLAYASSASNPLSSQIVASSGTQRLYLGSYYTGGVGASSTIQASDYWSSVDHGAPLPLNPLGGNVLIGLSTPSAFGKLHTYRNDTHNYFIIEQGNSSYQSSIQLITPSANWINYATGSSSILRWNPNTGDVMTLTTAGLLSMSSMNASVVDT